MELVEIHREILIMTSLTEKLNDLKKTVKPGEKPAVVKTEKVKKSKYIPKGGNGGKRPDSGRKPGGTAMQKRVNKELIMDHVSGEATVTVVDRKTGKTVTVKKPRIIAALEKLYELGMKGQGDANAIDRWMNRAIGKAIQPIVGDDDEPPVQVQDLGIAAILKKVYAKKNK